MISRLLSRVTFFCLLVACAKTTSHQVIQTERDGVPLIRTVGGPRYEGPIFELVPDLVLGIDEGEPEWQIFGSLQTLFSPDGRMVLGDWRRHELFIVSREGELLHRLGGEGAGPGEFRNLWLMHWIEPGEEFWVEDQTLVRINHFSMDGEYLGSFSRAPLMTRNIFIGILGKDRFLGWYGDRRGEERVSVYGFLNADLEWDKDFMTVRSSPSFKTGQNSYRPIPFTTGESCTTTPDGRILVSRPDEGQIALYSAEGKLLRYIEREWEIAPVTNKEKEDIRNRFRASSSQEFPTMAETMPFPDNYPPFRRATMDDRGWIWVEHQPRGLYLSIAGPRTYDIFNSDGVWLGTQQFDGLIKVSGDYVYRQYDAESGAPRLERFILKLLVDEYRGPSQ